MADDPGKRLAAATAAERLTGGSDHVMGRAQAGARWLLVEQWSQQFISLLAFVLIARVLAVEDVGVFALAAVFATFGRLFIEAGLGVALIQRRDVTSGHSGTVFWLSLGISVVLAMAGVAVAVPLGAYLGEPQLTPVLQALSCLFVMQALGVVPWWLLRRRLAFRALAIRTLVAVGAGATAGVALAYSGFGVWSLVGQQFVGALISVALLWRVTDWRVSLRPDLGYLRDMLRFGLPALGARVMEFLGRWLDNVFVGIFLGSHALGIYATGFRLFEGGHTVLTAAVPKAALPVFARLQEDQATMRIAFLKLSRLSSAVLIPTFVGLAVIAEDVIPLLLGQRWAASGQIVSVLLLVGSALLLSELTEAALLGSGAATAAFRLRLLATLANALAIGLAIAVWGTILAVAAAYVLRSYVMLPVVLAFLSRQVGVPVYPLIVDLVRIVLASIGMVLSMVTIRVILGDVPQWMTLVAQGASGVVTAVVLTKVLLPTTLVDLSSVGRRVLRGHSPVDSLSSYVRG